MDYLTETLNKMNGITVLEMRIEDEPDSYCGYWSAWIEARDYITAKLIAYPVNVALKSFGHAVEFVPTSILPDFKWVLRCYDATPPEQVADYLR